MRSISIHSDLPGQRLLEELTGDDPNVIERCTRCKRPLRTAGSRKAGMGRTCRRAAKGTKATEPPRQGHEG